MTDSLSGADFAPIAWADAAREQAFGRWFDAMAPRHRLDRGTLHLASADASSRRYFRVTGADGATFIVMDSPAAEDSVAAFVHIGGLILGAGLHAPRVLEQDVHQGFLLLDDLGSTQYLEALRAVDHPAADLLMRDAIGALIQWQLHGDCSTLPPYDDALLRREIQLFPDWCVTREFGVAWTPKEHEIWKTVSQRLIDSALAQPQVAVHRDWMPRNLMVCDRNPGVLDFQDAVRGPITYDLASLLRDAFLSWDEEHELDWAVRYWQQARHAGLPVDADFGEFWRQAEWMGLQRHLKILGIFCRLKHRDDKPHYSEDLPRFFNYATKVANRYGPLRPLLNLLEPLTGAGVQAGYTF
ncbi:MAG: aminoglycoside phosphotransferase family protein [Vitreoscilla sp.]|jgi:aminoglycoside/choline kinase family phosphotransferase